MLALTFFAAVVASLAYFWVQKRFTFWKKLGYPEAPISFPFGSLKGMGSEIPICLGIDGIYNSFKGRAKAVGLYFFFSPVLMATDIDLIKNIFIRDFSSFHDRGLYYNKKDDPLSANLLALEGQEWRDRRSKLSPVFTSGKMKLMFDLVDSIGDKFVRVIDKEHRATDKLDMRQLLAKFTTDVISSVAFGIDSNCLEDPNSEFYNQGKKLFDLSALDFVRLLLTNSFPDLARRLHLSANPKEPTEFLRKVFIETIRDREEKKVVRNDFIQLLFKLRDTVSLSLDEMAAESFIFFTAGFETSSSTLNFCLYELALNPDMQSRLRDEIKQGIEENNGKLSYDLLLKYEYLDMIVKETLRKYPIAPAQMRKCTKEYRIPETDLVIPEGKNVLLPTYSIHHDAEYYPEPEKFNPDRFSKENSKDRNPITFLAFGEGPRGCIGERFGMLQVKTALAKLLPSFEFSVCEKTVIPMKFVPAAKLLTPVGGMWLQLKKL